MNTFTKIRRQIVLAFRLANEDDYREATFTVSTGGGSLADFEEAVALLKRALWLANMRNDSRNPGRPYSERIDKTEAIANLKPWSSSSTIVE